MLDVVRRTHSPDHPETLAVVVDLARVLRAVPETMTEVSMARTAANRFLVACASYGGQPCTVTVRMAARLALHGRVAIERSTSGLL